MQTIWTYLRLKHVTMPIRKPTASCKMLCALFMLALQPVLGMAINTVWTPLAGEVPSLRCSAIATSSPGKQQELLATLQTAYVQVAAPWPCFPPPGELSQQYLISHKHRNQLHEYNKATLRSPYSPQFSTSVVTAILKFQCQSSGKNRATQALQWCNKLLAFSGLTILTCSVHS